HPLPIQASGKHLQTVIQPQTGRVQALVVLLSRSIRHCLTSPMPLAVSIAVLLGSAPAKAGFLSGSTGLICITESIPGPELPSIEFLKRFNEENQKKYAENDARNQQEILDKYYLRGAEWGVGDCSAEGMTPDEKEKFIAMLRKKTSPK
ncbi:hypothetical protein AKJ16_DCAP24772, partial [Drosera capensis]